MDVRLRPVRAEDLEMCRRFHTEPGLIGNDWFGYRDAGQVARRFAEDGYLGADNGRLIVEVAPAQRIQAGAQPEDNAEQKSLLKAGFQLEGVVRAAEFRAGQWRDGLLYSRLRDDPAPEV